jgi:hypothetical protein
MTAAEFKALFPEFKNAADDLVTSRLAWALARTPSDIWGTYQAEGVAWYTAHFLALLPNAKDMRKGEKPGESMYLRERQRLGLVLSSGYRVAGLPPGYT